MVRVSPDKAEQPREQPGGVGTLRAEGDMAEVPVEAPVTSSPGANGEGFAGKVAPSRSERRRPRYMRGALGAGPGRTAR